MVTPQNNPYVLMETQGILKAMLSQKSLTALDLFNKANDVSNKHPNSKEAQEQAEKAGQIAGKIMLKDLELSKNMQKNDIEELHIKTEKKEKSKQIVEKSVQVLDDLALCRKKLKEDRDRKIESGEISKPKKKTLTTKLRLDLARIIGLIPAKLKEDAKVIERTEKAVMKFLNELKSIWGMDKIKAIEEAIIEKTNKLREEAA